MLSSYNNFLIKSIRMDIMSILESENLHTSSEFLHKIKKISTMEGTAGEIASYIYNFIVEEDYAEDDFKQNYFDVTSKDDTVSFIQQNRIPIEWDSEENPSLPYNLKTRGEISIGRLVRKLAELIPDLNYLRLKDKDFESFVNAYKSCNIKTNKSFSIVKSKDIYDCYNSKKYYSTFGSLGGSCMADEKESFFGIYADNSDKVRMVVLKDNKGKIHGRALLWKLDKSLCKCKYFLDRIYVNSDSDLNRFILLAKKRGFMYKKRMNSHNSDGVAFVYKGNTIYGEISVKLNNVKFKKYPFIDTLCYLDKKEGILSNVPKKGNYFLQNIDGSCEFCRSCRGELVQGNDNKYLCAYCCDGHVSLSENGIETPEYLEVNKSEDDE